MKGILRKGVKQTLKTKNIRETSLELLKKNIDKIGVQVPLCEEDLARIYEWFQDKEIEMSNALADGEQVNSEELDLISKSADDFRIYEGENKIDLEDLNKRLQED